MIISHFSHHRLVAGKLAGTVNFPAHPMDKGIKPMQAYRKLHQPFIQNIPPLIMRQLMHRNPAKFLLRNIRAGQDDTGMKIADQHR